PGRGPDAVRVRVRRRRDQDPDRRGEDQDAERLTQLSAGQLPGERGSRQHAGDRSHGEVEREGEIEISLKEVRDGGDQRGHRNERERGPLGLVLLHVNEVDEERDEQNPTPDAHEPAQGAGQKPEDKRHDARPHGSAHPSTASGPRVDIAHRRSLPLLKRISAPMVNLPPIKPSRLLWTLLFLGALLVLVNGTVIYAIQTAHHFLDEELGKRFEATAHTAALLIRSDQLDALFPVGADSLRADFDVAMDSVEAAETVRDQWRRLAGGAGASNIILLDPDHQVVLVGLGYVRTQARLARVEERMNHADLLATVGQVAAGVAHEIRNPLAVLRGASSRLQKLEHLSAGERKELLAMLEEEVHRMGNVVQNFLDLSRRPDTEATIFVLRPVLERSMEIINVELSRCGVRSAVRWEAEDGVCIRGRPQAMHHLFLNLALNARDAMPEG